MSMQFLSKYLKTAFTVFMLGFGAQAQTTLPNVTCEHPIFVCLKDNFLEQNQDYDFRVPPGYTTCQYTTPFTLWYYVEVTNAIGTGFEIDCAAGMSGWTMYGPFAGPQPCCDAASSGVVNATSSTPNTVYTAPMPSVGFYYIQVQVNSCNGSVILRKTGSGNYGCQETISCDHCIGSFAPEPGKEYVLSGWVKENGAAATKTSYNYPTVSLVFPDVSTTLGPYSASGQIIDGWQRIEQKFTIPSGANEIDVKLSCSTGTCYFDDIRIFPNDGSMKSYVYDPETLRLVAELDERNYATMYEYDEEGKLVRIKKETERGIMTIQESKTSVLKQ